MEMNVYKNRYRVTEDSLQVYLREIRSIPLLSRENAALADEIRDLLSQLPARDQQILRLCFGMNEEPTTLEEIGAMYGITRARVRQIEKRAKHRWRQTSRMHALQEYLN
jgi:RNA polymerase primary sigma factor